MQYLVKQNEMKRVRIRARDTGLELRRPSLTFQATSTHRLFPGHFLSSVARGSPLWTEGDPV